MAPDIIASILAALASMAGFAFADRLLLEKLIRRLLGKKEPQQTYAERLSELTSSLTSASAKVDAVLQELSAVAREKEQSFKTLEEGLRDLERKEKELTEKIGALESVPLPVAEHFAKLVEPGERRSARRDYVLFGTGVVVTTIIALVLQAFAK